MKPSAPVSTFTNLPANSSTVQLAALFVRIVQPVAFVYAGAPLHVLDSPPTKFGLFAGGVILLLPGFLALTGALGLFDAWFDFRKLRASSTRGNPFALFHRSSADGPKDEE